MPEEEREARIAELEKKNENIKLSMDHLLEKDKQVDKLVDFDDSIYTLENGHDTNSNEEATPTYDEGIDL